MTRNCHQVLQIPRGDWKLEVASWHTLIKKVPHLSSTLCANCLAAVCVIHFTKPCTISTETTRIPAAPKWRRPYTTETTKPPHASSQQASAASRAAPPKSGEGNHCQHHASYPPLRVKCCVTLHAALGPNRLAHPRAQRAPTRRATSATNPKTTSTTPRLRQPLMRTTYLFTTPSGLAQRGAWATRELLCGRRQIVHELYVNDVTRRQT